MAECKIWKKFDLSQMQDLECGIFFKNFLILVGPLLQIFIIINNNIFIIADSKFNNEGTLYRT